MAMNLDISIVILCYKAEKRGPQFARDVIKSISEITSSWEVILVGNYDKDSDDITPLIIREMDKNNSQIKAVTLVKKGMMGWDARSGFRECNGNTIALVDGDGQMSSEDIKRVYLKLIDEELDIVKTFRIVRGDGLIRKINSEIYNVIFRILFPGFNVRDVNSKPKIFTRELYDKLALRSDDWFLDAEIMIKARRYKCKLGEIPTVFTEAKGRQSFVKAKHIIEFIRNLFIARWQEFFVKE